MSKFIGAATTYREISFDAFFNAVVAFHLQEEFVHL